MRGVFPQSPAHAGESQQRKHRQHGSPFRSEQEVKCASPSVMAISKYCLAKAANPAGQNVFGRKAAIAGNEATEERWRRSAATASHGKQPAHLETADEPLEQSGILRTRGRQIPPDP